LTARVTYDNADKMGVTVIVTCAALSLACVVFMLGLMGLSFWRKRSTGSKHFFMRSHAAPYFTCLLISDLIQVIGSLMSSKWISDNGIDFGSFCSIQGAIKNAGNLGISLWTLVLAVHTFCVLFLRWNPRDWALYSTLIGVWFLIGFLIVIGPGAIQQAATKGPYYSIAGLWCWIADPYPAARIYMEYFWMFFSAGASFILYTLTFLRLRGNLYVEGRMLKFRRVSSSDSWKYIAGRDLLDLELTKVAKGMLGFPVMFTVVILPIAVCRFIEWSGKPVPLEATIFAASLFNLTGVFALILFMTTRSLLPQEGFFANSRITPRPKVASTIISNEGIQPYLVSDFSSAHGFAEKYQTEAEQTIKINPPPRTQASLNPRSRSISPDAPQIKLPLSLDTEKAQYDHVSRTDANIETPNAWDDIDLGRQVQAREDNFGSDNLSRVPSIDKRYTAFTISAYADRDEPTGEYDMESYPGPYTGRGSSTQNYDEEKAVDLGRKTSSNTRI